MSADRPASITVIAWILIVMGILGYLYISSYLSRELIQHFLVLRIIPVTIIMIYAYAGNTLSLVLGIAMLKGLNWGRILYLCYTPASIAIYWLLFGIRPAIYSGSILYIIYLILLTRPKSSAFFKAKRLTLIRPPT